MADVEFSITGLDSVLEKMKTVSDEVRYKGGRFALRKAANLVAAKAKEKAQTMDDPETGRSIAANIAVRWNGRYFKRTGDIAFRVGVLHGAILPEKDDGGNVDEGPNGPTPHWRLLEFGTSNMPAHPFMRPALADNINQVTSEFVTQLEKAIDRAIKKNNKGGK